MTWTVKRTSDGYEFHDGTRVRAVVRNRQASARPWHVYRIRHDGREDRADSFRWWKEAKEFVTHNPAVWSC